MTRYEVGAMVTSTESKYSFSRKKGDEVEDEDDDDDDDDMVRTSVSKDRVTATLCNEELFLRTQYI
jgi:hypothetical protein